VRFYRTVSPVPDTLRRRAVCSLLHCPSSHLDWPLASTLPCGARTFLDGRPKATAATTCPARARSAHHYTAPPRDARHHGRWTGRAIIDRAMRSVGGAGIGVLAWLLLPACFPMPPPDPGRPPPPPEMLPAPPPDPVHARPAAPAAEAAAEPGPALDLDWDSRSRTVRCGDAALSIPADLAVYVRQNGDEITIVPPGSPPGAALLVMPIGDLDEPIEAAQFVAYEKRVLRIPDAMARLHAMASGKELGEGHKDVRTNSDGLVDIAYTDSRTPDMIWRLGVAYAGGCVFLSLDLVRPDAAQRFVPMLQRFCAAKRSRCQKQMSVPFSPIPPQEEE